MLEIKEIETERLSLRTTRSVPLVLNLIEKH